MKNLELLSHHTVWKWTKYTLSDYIFNGLIDVIAMILQ